MMADGKTEWSSAEVADSLVWIAVCGYGRRAVTPRGEYANVLLAMPKDPGCVSSALQAVQIAPSSVARAFWCG